MRVYIRPEFRGEDKGDGGIRRWIEAQHRYLPTMGIDLAGSEGEADLVVCHAGDLVTTTRPIVAHCHGVYPTAQQPWDKWAWMLNEKVIEVIRRSEVVTVPSRWVADLVARGMNRRARVLYAGIEPADWEPGENQGYILWNKTRPDPVCDPVHMDRLAALNPRNRFISTFGNPAPNVQLIGRLSYLESRELIRNAGVYLATTKETFGIGTLEAMACRVPVLGWAEGGNLDIIRHDVTGYLARPGDYDDLQRGLVECLARRAEMGEAAREDVLARFTWAGAMLETADLYREVLDRATRPQPKVSVVIANYRLEEFLPECLRSLQGQSMADWEALIVDDCSPGACKEIVDDFAKADGRIRYLRTPRNMYLSSRNFGLLGMRGRYHMILDADDMLAPLALEVLAGHLDQHPEHAIAYGACSILEPDGRQWTSPWPPAFRWAEQMAGHNQIPYAALCRRVVYEIGGGYRPRCQNAEDADLWCRVTSFGARPFRATDYPYLIKRQRGDSVGHTEAPVDFTAWYPWAKDKRLVPWGSVGEAGNGVSWPVFSYDPPKVSVVIPVGPGHEELVGDALDSVLAQTEPAWEAIVVNDTGRPLNLAGYPWAKVIDTTHCGVGPAAARNMGIAAARAPLIALLDGDDYYLPTFLERTMAMQAEAGGYVYTDWFEVAEDGAFKRVESANFNPQDLIDRGLTFAVNALIPREAWLEAGGFDIEAPSWEDWDFFFNLATRGVCGTRCPEPLFAYRYWSGQRREVGFAQAAENVQHLRTKWRQYMNGGKRLMGCGGGCGGGRSTPAPTTQVIQQAQRVAMAAQASGTERLEYVGPAIADRGFKGPVTGTIYTFGNNETHRRGFVYAVDAEGLLRYPDFKRVPDKPATPVPTEPLPVRQMGRRADASESVQEPTLSGSPLGSPAPAPDSPVAVGIAETPTNPPSEPENGPVEAAADGPA